MEQSNYRCAGTTLVTMAYFALACIIPFPADAQIDCSTLPQWSALPQQGQPQFQVNLQHVFCGAVKFNNNGIATHLVGFHSRPGGINPTTVDLTDLVGRPGRKGDYDLRWTSKIRSVGSHRSTMFPDTCTMAQVVRSIIYAQENSRNCDRNTNFASPEFKCGPNGPQAVDNNFCYGSDGTGFTIVVSLFNESTRFINTGFPL